MFFRLCNSPTTFVTPVTHRPCTSASDLMQVQTCHNRYIWVDRMGQDQEWTTNRMEQFALSDIIFDFQHMYISRRGDTVGSPVWKSTILHVFLKSELSVLETVAVQAPTTYVEPSTLSYTNSYRVSHQTILHGSPLMLSITPSAKKKKFTFYSHFQLSP